MPSQSSQSSLEVRQIIGLGLLIAIALVLSYFERLIPTTLIAPGVKLGLANVVTVLGLSLLTPKELYFLVVSRVLLAALIIGSMMSLWYSLAGGLLSVTAMLIMTRLGKDQFTIIGISVVGAICHNIGQVMIVSFVTGSFAVGITYLPVLMVTGVITGIFIGFVAKATKPYLTKLI